MFYLFIFYFSANANKPDQTSQKMLDDDKLIGAKGKERDWILILPVDEKPYLTIPGTI